MEGEAGGWLAHLDRGRGLRISQLLKTGLSAMCRMTEVLPPLRASERALKGREI